MRNAAIYTVWPKSLHTSLQNVLTSYHITTTSTDWSQTSRHLPRPNSHLIHNRTKNIVNAQLHTYQPTIRWKTFQLHYARLGGETWRKDSHNGVCNQPQHGQALGDHHQHTQSTNHKHRLGNGVPIVKPKVASQSTNNSYHPPQPRSSDSSSPKLIHTRLRRTTPTSLPPLPCAHRWFPNPLQSTPRLQPHNE